MKTARLLLAGFVLAAAVVAPAQFGGLGGLGDLGKKLDTGKDLLKMTKGLAGVGPEAEADIGDSVALEVITKYGGLVRDDDIMRRINLVGRSLARYSDRPHLNWRFAVLDSDTVNAFSAPDGYVFITRGLYIQAADDDRLAAILGHEIAHITNRHALKIVSRADFLSGATGILARQSNNTREFNRYASQLGLNVEKVASILLDRGFDPASEYVSDQDGHDLAATVGFAPGGLRAVLQDLQRKGENRKTMFSTHPPMAERIKRLPDEPAPATAVAVTETDGKN